MNEFRIVCQCSEAMYVTSNLVLLNAILYVAEHGCKWRRFPSDTAIGTVFMCA